MLLSERIARWRNFEECLLHELRWSRGLYTADVTFNYVWGPDGRVRESVLEEPLLVTLRLVGIEDLRFVGALTDGMKQSPDRIDWGLAEVANVSVFERGDLLGLSVDWESGRHLEATCVSMELIEPVT